MAMKNNSSLVIREGFTITAHAGAMSLPENSIIALRRAINAGVDVVEMDVTLRPDGTPVIIHSETPKQNEGVLLDEALSVVAESDKIKINLDLKQFENINEVQKLVLKHGLNERVFFTGIEENAIETVKSQCPLIPYYLNKSIDKALKNRIEYSQSLANKILELGCVGLNCSYKGMSKNIVEAVHKNGLLVSVWTVDSKSDIEKMLTLCVDNITTRKPLKIKALIHYEKLKSKIVNEADDS